MGQESTRSSSTSSSTSLTNCQNRDSASKAHYTIFHRCIDAGISPNGVDPCTCLDLLTRTVATVPAMLTQPDFIFFTDFDGTITLQDSNDYLIDNLGCGQPARKKANQDVLLGKSTRDLFEWMMDSVQTPYHECMDILCDNIKLDPCFAQFYEWARDNNIPVVILSGGLRPGIKALLVHLLGEKYANEIQIVANDVERRDPKVDLYTNGGWKVKFHDKSDFGHDKSMEIRKYSSLPNRPTLFYAGDGVSDLSAAKETDLLFAKEGGDLITYCVKEGVPFTQFRDWSTIHDTVRDIVQKKTTVDKVVIGGLTNFIKQKYFLDL